MRLRAGQLKVASDGHGKTGMIIMPSMSQASRLRWCDVERRARVRRARWREPITKRGFPEHRPRLNDSRDHFDRDDDAGSTIGLAT
jgi:hypothetical protein